MTRSSVVSWSLCAALAVIGCTPEVSIIGEISAETPVADPVTRDAVVGVALLEQEALLLTAIDLGGTGDGRMWLEMHGRWLDPDHLPRTDDLTIGRGINTQSLMGSWRRIGDEVVAQLWVSPPEAELPAPSEATVGFHHIDASAGHTVSSINLGVWRRGLAAPLEPGPYLSEASLRVGLEGALPLAVVGGLARGAALGSTARCEFNYWALMLYGDGDMDPALTLGGANACDPSGSWRVRAPWLVTLDDDRYGVLYRDIDEELTWLTVDRDGNWSVPRRVGSRRASINGAGAQARGARAGSRVVFLERELPLDDCYRIRVMNLDGSDAHDAPWQLRCERDVVRGMFDLPERAMITSFVDVLPMEGAVLLVWSEVPEPDRPEVMDPGGIRAVLLTPEGQRGSEIFDVTTPAPLSGYFRAAYDGERAVVAWHDAASLEPRIRRIRVDLR